MKSPPFLCTLVKHPVQHKDGAKLLLRFFLMPLNNLINIHFICINRRTIIFFTLWNGKLMGYTNYNIFVLSSDLLWSFLEVHLFHGNKSEANFFTFNRSYLCLARRSYRRERVFAGAVGGSQAAVWAVHGLAALLQGYWASRQLDEQARGESWHLLSLSLYREMWRKHTKQQIMYVGYITRQKWLL